MMRSVGSAAPARWAKVGKKSMWEESAPHTLPFGMAAGQLMMQGTRWPPSQVEHLAPRSGPLLAPWSAREPLSEVKTMRVLS